MYLAMQCLRDNTGGFKKDKTITNLIIVRNREEVANRTANRSAKWHQ